MMSAPVARTTLTLHVGAGTFLPVKHDDLSRHVMHADRAARGAIEPWQGETALFITPGFRFRVVDLLLSNFHLPRSTLFMLVAAFAGLARMKAAYAHAIAAGYRFFSYGDTCLIEPAEPRA